MRRSSRCTSCDIRRVCCSDRSTIRSSRIPGPALETVNPGALGLYLNLGYIPAPYALLTDSAALEAGTWMSVEQSGHAASGRYFTFPRASVPDLHGREALEAVDAAVESSVRRQMVSDVPVGVLLSGGVDSPLVAAAMRQATNASIPAFTLGTSGDALDESPDARRYAEALGLRHVVEHIAPADVIGLLDDVVAAYSEPADDYSIFPTALISRVAREQVTVVLSGDGGDDIFWGYPERMIRPLRAAAGGSPGWYASLRRSIAEQPGAAQLRRSRFVDGAMLRSIFPSLPALPDDFGLFRFDGGVDGLAQWIRWNEYTGHLAGVLQKVDRASMHHSLEVRVPLLDREVVDVATRVDWRSSVDLGREVGKLPLRAALERRVGFQTMRKRGFEVPMTSWLRGPLRPLFEDLVLSRHELLGLPLEQAALARVFHRHVMRIESSGWLLWRLLSLALWEARHFRSVLARA